MPKTRTIFPLLMILLLGCAAAMAGAAPPADLAPPELAAAGFEEESSMLLEDEAEGVPPGLRVVVAAPRGAVMGKASSVLLAMRPGRTLHVETGETIRFIAGLREAVWYRGPGIVGSGLQLEGGPVGGPLVPLGGDRIALPGEAPRIDGGLTRAHAHFEAAGEYAVRATVAAGVRTGRDHARGDSRSSTYRVVVHEPGILGSISGFVGRDTDGAALRDLPVIALDASTGEPVSSARTGCDGGYDIPRLPPGDYFVMVPARRGFEGELYDDATDRAGADPLTVAPGAAVGGIDFLLSRP